MTSRFYAIKKDLFLVESEVENAKGTSAPVANNHVWIFDRSGSMSWQLSRLCDDMKARTRTLNAGETLSLAWFSSEGGEFRFILKGYKISEKETYKEIDAILDKHKSTVGMTCFSEVLLETTKVIEDLSAFGSFSLTLFTDGQPCVSNYNKELEQVFKAVGKLADQVTSALLVGYGNYYNKSLMQDIAQRLNGALVHANDIASFGASLDEYIKTSREAGDKVRVKLDQPDGQLYFSVFGNNVVSYRPEKGEVTFTIGKGKKDFIYTLTNKIQGKAEEIKDIDALGPRHSFIKGFYGLAVALSQTGDVQLATDVLASIGDKKLIDSLYDSFTNDEYGRAEKEISAAMASPSARFVSGRVLNYVKPDDAPCVLDALEAISQDKTAEFFPYAGTGYARTGVKTEKKTEVEFIPADKGYAVSSLSWNDKRLNLSMTTEIEGHVELDDRHKKFNLSKEFACKIYRSFTFVKDGILNVKKPTLSLSLETHNKLVFDMGVPFEVIEGSTARQYDLTVLPIMNRSYANSIKSVKTFADLAVKEAELEGIAKVLKSEVKAAAKAAAETTQNSYGSQVEAYLAEFHINAAKGTFTPPTTKGEAEDYYLGKTFEIKIKGLSSLPKVDDVRKKLADKKKLTTADNVVVAGLSLLDKTPKAKLEAELAAKTQELRTTRAKLQRAKFAIVMGKTWFDEFKGERLDEYNYTHNGYELTLKLGEVKVNY